MLPRYPQIVAAPHIAIAPCGADHPDGAGAAFLAVASLHYPAAMLPRAHVRMAPTSLGIVRWEERRSGPRCFGERLLSIAPFGQSPA
jgi:hypothetical protein